ncbi:ImmA/IrrE family metallo-endopeptidase [Polaromonas sp. DSR2-3-2]|uniref:ImmA/IrrE family metallo-endopeptidase n=1 Tax=unclassified Polaromonas TaxID=2638319 RepID=UPI003CF50F99
MNISSHDLSCCINKAKEISEVYNSRSLNSSDPKRSLDLLTEVCTDSSGRPIEIYKGDGDENDRWLYGTCLLYPEKSVVLYAHYLNSCWERFTVCKELFHIVLDQDEYRTIDIFQHIQNIILAFPDDEASPTKPVICEILAEIAAMEFMLPYLRREQIIKVNGWSAMDIAQQYKIPCLLVEKYLSKHYMLNLKNN